MLEVGKGAALGSAGTSKALAPEPSISQAVEGLNAVLTRLGAVEGLLSHVLTSLSGYGAEGDVKVREKEGEGKRPLVHAATDAVHGAHDVIDRIEEIAGRIRYTLGV